MANAFKNYTNLASALEQANDTKNQAIQLKEEAQEKAALTGKTIGELKSAITGKSASSKIVKDIIKPRIKAKLDDIAKKKLEQLRNKLEKGTADSTTSGDTGGENAGSGGVENEPTTTTDLANGETEAPSYDDMLGRSTQATEDRFNELFGDSNEARGSSMTDDEANSLMEKGLARVSKFESRVASGDASGLETSSISRANLGEAFNINNTPKIDFEDEDLGEEETGNVYSRANGLSDSETSTLRNWWGAKNDASGPDEIENLAQNFGSRAGNFTNQITNMRINNIKPTVPTAEESADSGISVGGPESEASLANAVKEKAAKMAADKLAKMGAKKLGEEDAIDAGGEDAAVGGGEAVSGVLDAIPGLDILGFIAGGVLAGIEGHKQHKEERLEENQAEQSSPMTFQSQAGVGMDN